MYSDEFYMHQALTLARNGAGFTRPNPMVGALLVKDDIIVGKGYHQLYGGPHAEVHAILSAGRNTFGSTLYVNLEPCSHQGKTPPCCEAVVKAGIARVVCAMEDPNPEVSGKGIAYLREHGVTVRQGVLNAEAEILNEIFIKYIRTKKPFVILKFAMSLDGKIATSIGESRWITGEESRRETHKLRHCCAAIMVGVNTVIADNPLLTTRIEDGSDRYLHPVRIVMDSNGRTPPDCNLLKTIDLAPVIIVTSPEIPDENRQRLEQAGAEILTIAGEDRVDIIRQLLPELGKRQIDSLIAEGGGTLADACVRSGCVDKYLTFIAPMLIGGISALTPLEGEGFLRIGASPRLRGMRASAVGKDILIEAYPDESWSG